MMIHAVPGQLNFPGEGIHEEIERVYLFGVDLYGILPLESLSSWCYFLTYWAALEHFISSRFAFRSGDLLRSAVLSSSCTEQLAPFFLSARWLFLKFLERDQPIKITWRPLQYNEIWSKKLHNIEDIEVLRQEVLRCDRASYITL